MTLDISGVDAKTKRLFKENPDLLKSLEESIPKQVDNYHRRKVKEELSKAAWQRDMDIVNEKIKGFRSRAETIKRSHDPMLKRATEHFLKDIVRTEGLLCPKCGDPDFGNRMNKKPWCMKCNVALSPKGEKSVIKVVKDKDERRVTFTEKGRV